MTKLPVYFSGRLAGWLRPKKDSVSFTYDNSWMLSGQRPISISLPFDKMLWRDGADAFFFASYAPDRMSGASLFDILKSLSGGQPGALSFRPMPNDSEAIVPPDFLKAAKFRQLCLSCGVMPGRRDKISCAVAGDRVHVLKTERARRSTHVFKPSWSYAANEGFCLTLASFCGLNVAPFRLVRTGGGFGLALERFDRLMNEPVHCESLFQALGTGWKHDYEGGMLEIIADLLVRILPERDRRRFMSAIFFAMLVGNTEAHTRNYCILHNNDGSFALAPMFDCVCMTAERLAMRDGKNVKILPLSPDNLENEKFAICFNEALRLVEIRPRDLEWLAGNLGLAPRDGSMAFLNVASKIRRNLDSAYRTCRAFLPELDSCFQFIAKTIWERTEIVLPLLGGIERRVR